MLPLDPKKPRKKRYDIPDAERWPGSKEPVPEVRPDLPAPESEKGEESPIDTEYGGMVSKYFNEKRKIADLTDVEDTELFDYDRFLVMEQQSLEKLSNPETAGAMRPEDVSLTMGDLAGTMAGRDPNIRINRTGDAAADKETERDYGAAKKLFMESGKRVFPGISVDTGDIGNELKLTSERLSREVDPTGRLGRDLAMPDLTGQDIQAMMESDPKALAGKIDLILHETGDLMQMRSRIAFDTGSEAEKGELAQGAKWLYKLQLIRDRLQAEMYDSKDVTASEADEIEKVRRSLGIDAAPAEQEKGKKEGPKLLEKPGVEADPALRALKDVFPDQGNLAERLASMAAKVDRLSDLKLRSDDAVTPDRARAFSVRQVFAELLPAELAALEQAAKKDKTSAEGLFISLMTAVKEAE